MRSSGAGSALEPFAGKAPREVWPTLGLPRQRAVMAALCRITLHPVATGQRAINPDGVRFERVWEPDPKAEEQRGV